MRRLLGTLFFIVTSLSAYDYALKPVRITSDVTCFIGLPEVMNTTNNGNITNNCYIDAGDGYVVVDTGPSYAYAASAYKAMQRIKPLPVKLVINTHIHDDHWLGNNFYTQMGVRVLGSDDFKVSADMSTPARMQTYISPNAYAQSVPTMPTDFISTDTNLSIGNQTLHLIFAKQKAHTLKDMVVYVPKSKVLIAADLVFNDRLPSVRGGDINGWLSTLDDLDKLGAEHVVGGHGYRTDKNAAQMTREYFMQMRAEIRAAIADGLGIDETVKKVSMDTYKKYKLYEGTHRQNVETSYRTLEWEQQ
ncbi:MAG: MBL fold metallo-hydrolase [Sulfuricurvum sp.]|uniref:MBL fold metallo-hydrolase n=1 Tax=Sulfuricurvum sp. TaxID=2025608 RepID=UPI00262DB7BC|nr:MBL fold metallo-hydrolase [Sulfuricurvum sp.]MDD2829981.1 MBL fold metallo-hydrolase [Sulfuricurvum sp.]MDD4949086.1 MBL fold metallo-hydrolase [Sulfuricurvum sp.]